MKVMVEGLTLRFLMNEIDCLLHLRLEYEQGEKADTIKFIKQFTAQLHAAGATAKQTGGYKRTYSEKMTGADGTHPDEHEPYLTPEGTQGECEDCHDKLGIKRGIVKKGVRLGQPFALIVHTTNRKCEKNYGFID